MSTRTFSKIFTIPMEMFGKQFESIFIVVSGMIMHTYGFSVIASKSSKQPTLTPNVASCLYVFSVICIMAKLRPLWPKALRKPPRLLLYFVELGLILYATDFMTHQVWVPLLKLLDYICYFMAEYVIVGNKSFLQNKAPQLSIWLRDDAFYPIRFLLAAMVFLFMLYTTGNWDRALSLLRPEPAARTGCLRQEKRLIYDDLQFEELLQEQFERYKRLQRFRGDDDSLTDGSRVGGRRKGKQTRKTKRGKAMLDTDTPAE